MKDFFYKRVKILLLLHSEFRSLPIIYWLILGKEILSWKRSYFKQTCNKDAGSEHEIEEKFSFCCKQALTNEKLRK